jgi:hypothetical protein
MSELLLHITPGQENERGPLYMESVLSSLHALTGKEKVVRLEIGSHEGKVGLFARMHTDAKELFSSQIAAQYPDSDIVEVPDPFIVSESQEIVSVTLKLKRPEVFPIRRHPQFDDLLTRVNMDPIASLCSALSRYPSPGMQGHISLTLKPLSGSFRKRSLRFLPLLRKGLSGFSDVYHAYSTCSRHKENSPIPIRTMHGRVSCMATVFQNSIR